MLKVGLRNLLERKVRLLLTGFAIVLGVSFVSGSLIFTDAMGGAFDDIIEGSTSDVEVGFKGANDFQSQQDVRTIPAAVVEDMRQLPGAAAVTASNALQSVYVIGKEGKVIGGQGAPGLAFTYSEGQSVTGEPIVRLIEGERPTGPNQIALDVDTVEKSGYAVGDKLTLVTPGVPPTMEVELTGIVEFGAGGLSGASLTLFEEKFMQAAFFDGEQVYTAISMTTKEGVSQDELRDQANAVLPTDIVARSGDDVVKENEEGLATILGFLNTFLLVFAGVSLVVGTFLIINTFSILVAQRSRELALLRALGASRGQVNRSVLFEALVVGVLGSTVGLGAGYLLAQGLKAIFALLGLDLSRATFPVHASTVFWSYAVGIVVTTLAAYLPARRASYIAPVAALRDDVALPESALHRRLVVGAVLAAAGALSMGVGLAGDGRNALIMIGAGMLAILVGVALLSPIAARPVIHLFGHFYRRAFGTVGSLATENSIRNPRRTAATASALMIGLALVAMMSIVGGSASASTDAAVGKSLTSQFIVSNVVNTPFSTDIASQLREVDGVSSVAQLKTAYPEIKGSQSFVAAVDPEDFALAIAVPVTEGSLADLGPGKVALSQASADGLGVGLGDTVPVKFQAGTVKLAVVAIFDNGGGVPAPYLVTPDAFIEGGLAPLDSMLFVTKVAGAKTDQVRAAIEKVTEDLPTVTVKDPEGYADEQKQQIAIFLNLIYALLGLSVVIAILGVVNTLGLSVIERTREVGLLRAIGLSRRQLRQMVRLEAVIVAVFGALLGVGMGLAFGIAIVSSLRDDGLTETSVPWLNLAIFVLAAAVVGVLAAVFPARRAAKLNVLESIATE